MSAFVPEDRIAYHTYSTYARGLDALWGMYKWLGRLSGLRQEISRPWFQRKVPSEHSSVTVGTGNHTSRGDGE